MDLNKKIGERISQLRKERKLTAEKLAWGSDLSKSCVCYAEQGARDIKLSTIDAICKGMQISLAEFFKPFV